MKKIVRVVGIGEVLWDQFPDASYFGGAPANFACLAKGIGGDQVESFVVSAVGQDSLGMEAIHELEKRHVDTTHLQVNRYPTGRVIVRLDSTGVPNYRIEEDAAWDHLMWNPQLGQFASTVDAVCFGTLGQRHAESRDVIYRFLQSVPERTARILDINLRPPYVDSEILLNSMASATILKLNIDEVGFLKELLKLEGNTEEVARALIGRFDLKLVIATFGAEGSMVIPANGSVHQLQPELISMVDSVGAGDAFTATFCLNLLSGADVEGAHAHAVRVASYVCTQPGATPQIPHELRMGFGNRNANSIDC